MKKIIFALIVLLLGAFVYIKLQALGSPQSGFNQTTRYTLGKHPFYRTIFGLHKTGDARGEYFGASGGITVEWFKPQSEEVDESVVKSFASKVSEYTGRPAQAIYGGAISDGALELSNLPSFQLKSQVQMPAGSVLTVYFASDFSPRQDARMSATYKESGIVLSLKAHRDFARGFSRYTDQYMLTSLLREFGTQLGLKDTPGNSSECIMNRPAGVNGQPPQAYSGFSPMDFCLSERDRLNQIRYEYQ